MPPRLNRRLFPPVDKTKPRNKGSRELGVLTAGGEVRLRRSYFWSGKGGSCPADALLGVEGSSITAGARQLCCLMAIGQDFDQAGKDLLKVGGLSVSSEKLRQITESEGKAARQLRDEGKLPAAWSAGQAKLPDGKSRIYGGVDGVFAPTVTQVEKNKRRQQHITRRQQRGKTRTGNTKDLPPPKPGTDERFKEMKIGIFYDQDKTHRHAFATERLSNEFAPLLKTHARQIGFEQADQTICLFDGAVWIFQQVCLALVSLQAVLLDFYHLAEHVHAAARLCIGEGEEARKWVADRLAEAKRSDTTTMLAAITALEKKLRSPAKKQSLRGLHHYIHQRREMLDYARAIEQGWDIGSGPTEATCKTLTLRIKRPGMKWDRDNAAAMMNLLALRESGQWDLYWNSQITANAA
jgi:hypothetical protein